MLAIIEDLSMYSRAERLVRRGPAHRIERFLPRLRVAFADDLLIAMGLLLHRLDRDRAPLPVVAIEQPIVGARPDLRELVGQVEGVLDTAVHAHAAERIVDVGGVAGEQDAAVPKALRHPLMHVIERAMRDPVRLGPRAPRAAAPVAASRPTAVARGRNSPAPAPARARGPAPAAAPAIRAGRRCS